MPLNDRECTDCNLYLEDIYENYDDTVKEYITCPKCGSSHFKKILRAPRIDTAGLYAGINYLDNERAKSAAGHGNISFHRDGGLI